MRGIHFGWIERVGKTRLRRRRKRNPLQLLLFLHHLSLSPQSTVHPKRIRALSIHSHALRNSRHLLHPPPRNIQPRPSPRITLSDSSICPRPPDRLGRRRALQIKRRIGTSRTPVPLKTVPADPLLTPRPQSPGTARRTALETRATCWGPKDLYYFVGIAME